MGTSTKPRKAYKQRLIAIPMTDGMRAQFAMQLHTSILMLEVAPSADHFDAIAQIFNVVSLTIENDARFQSEARVLEGGARALSQIAERNGSAGDFQASRIEMAPVIVAARFIDEKILPRLDLTKLYLANIKLSSMVVR